MKTHKQVMIMLLIISLLLAGSVSAVTKQPNVQKRYYIGINLPYNTIGGDFSKTSLIEVRDTSNIVTEVLMTPELKDGMGFGITAGYTKVGLNHIGYSVELSYHRTSHDYAWSFYTGKATLSVVNFDFKGLYSLSVVEPYLFLGIAIPWINIENGGGLRANGTYDLDKKTDAKYTGIGFNIGAGIEFFLTPSISFGGRAAYRWIRYSNVTGYSGKVSIQGGVKGSGMHICAGLTFNVPAN